MGRGGSAAVLLALLFTLLPESSRRNECTSVHGVTQRRSSLIVNADPGERARLSRLLAIENIAISERSPSFDCDHPTHAGAIEEVQASLAGQHDEDRLPLFVSKTDGGRDRSG